MDQFGAQSVISIEGEWGRGKTDVLRRMYRAITDRRRGDHAFWINPWQYGTTDLLTPLVSQMAAAVAKKSENRDRIIAAVRILILAGVNFGLKATVMPSILAGVIDEKQLKEMVAGVVKDLTDKDAATNPISDPVAAMAGAFRDLVDELCPKTAIEQGMVYVFVDDIDRCMPDRQVAMLEALRFLLSAGARARFVIALDPYLANEALVVHFRVASLDTERFLDKLFHLRYHIPTLTKGIRPLIDTFCKIEVGTDARRSQIPGGPDLSVMLPRMFDKGTEWPRVAEFVFSTEGVNNPRTISRAIRRLIPLVSMPGPPKIEAENVQQFFGWLALSVRWPEARRAYQYVQSLPNGSWENFRAAVGLETTKERLTSGLVRNLRFGALSSDGAFGAFVSKVFNGDVYGAVSKIEDLFQEAQI